MRALATAMWVMLPATATLASETSDSARERHWEVSLQLEQSSLDLAVDPEGSAAKFRYAPNNPPGFKVGLRYRGFGGAFGFARGRLDDDRHVTTRSQDIQLFWHHRWVGLDLYYQAYEGYCLETDAGDPVLLFPDLKLSTQTINLYGKILGSADLTALSSPGSVRESTRWLVYGSGSVSHRTVLYTFAQSSGEESLPRDWRISRSLDALVPSASVGALVVIPLGSFYVAPGLGVGIGQPMDLSEPPASMDAARKFNLRLMTGSVSASGEWGLHAYQDSDILEFENGSVFQFTSLRLRLFKSWKF